VTTATFCSRLKCDDTGMSRLPLFGRVQEMTLTDAVPPVIFTETVAQHQPGDDNEW
jgi:hypothetical protein